MPLDHDQTAVKDLCGKLAGPEYRYAGHKHVARRAGVSRSLISKICAGDKKVTPKLKAKIKDGMRAEIKRLQAILKDYERDDR
ncbi:LacI family DNA-binding transcriptional regulator [Bradyrhizobium sp. S69]|uniref:LacI family DNA-binding transcriptional regulator n=1 Tax=Bradyrhizobium sp. S69 TaxID=1641856 RepID=UPI00131EA494|nr:LacI family DNA-binding transcriptional regulator [Bradyrhizobium sp. S69]